MRDKLTIPFACYTRSSMAMDVDHAIETGEDLVFYPVMVLTPNDIRG